MPLKTNRCISTVTTLPSSNNRMKLIATQDSIRNSIIHPAAMSSSSPLVASSLSGLKPTTQVPGLSIAILHGTPLRVWPSKCSNDRKMRSSYWNHRPVGWRKSNGLARIGERGFPTPIISGIQKEASRLSKMIQEFRFFFTLCPGKMLRILGWGEKKKRENWSGMQGLFAHPSLPMSLFFFFSFTAKMLMLRLHCLMYCNSLVVTGCPSFIKFTRRRP